jgi:hypothetical protein
MDRDDLHNRFSYHPATPDTAESYAHLRQMFEALALAVDGQAPDSREKSLAITHLEDALMWANKAIAMTTPVDDVNDHIARVLPPENEEPTR